MSRLLWFSFICSYFISSHFILAINELESAPLRQLSDRTGHISEILDSKRTKVSRFVESEHIVGVGKVQVLKINQYSLTAGEQSVFDQEGSKFNRATFLDTKVDKKVISPTNASAIILSLLHFLLLSNAISDDFLIILDMHIYSYRRNMKTKVSILACFPFSFLFCLLFISCAHVLSFVVIRLLSIVYGRRGADFV